MRHDTGYLAAAARSRHFRLGVARDATVAPDGARVAFLRAAAGDDPATSLWCLDVRTGAERLVADGAACAADGPLTAAEQARRQRAREQAAGIVGYHTDAGFGRAVFAVDGALWTVPLGGGEPVRLPATGSVVDPRLSPDGSTVAYVSGGALRLIGADGTNDRALADPEDGEVTYGLAEHVAGESMYRSRGHWWSPDSSRLLVSRVDTAPVQRWYIGDPANPDSVPAAIAYPSAGTHNADVSLWRYDSATGQRVEVVWDRAGFEYLAAVCWTDPEPLLLVQSRDQRDVQVRRVDPDTGSSTLWHADHDDAWWELVPGLPAVLPDGALVWSIDDGQTRRLTVDGAPVTPPGLQVRDVSGVDGDAVLFHATAEATETHLWRWRADTGAERLSDHPGVHGGTCRGGTTVLTSRSIDYPGIRVVVRPGTGLARPIRSVALRPPLEPNVRLHSFGARSLRTAVLLPTGHRRGDGRLPVLLDPYGGPHQQIVVNASGRYLTSQWFADQGYAVVITDGRGTPGRGPVWEKAVHRDKLTAPLDDQVDALRDAAEAYPELDLTRVGIRGWSYGGYLAAAAVLRRPDVFHVAVAGAPVTDPLLYDTHWMERYLGHPDVDPAVYQRNSLIPDAPRLTRPLMLIHGLADDNVYVAHTLRLSGALLAAGRDHTVLPLTGETHMTTGDVAVSLPRLELSFLDRALRDGVLPHRQHG